LLIRGVWWDWFHLICLVVLIIVDYRAFGGIKNCQEKPKYSEKINVSAILCITNPCDLTRDRNRAAVIGNE
jgi:hypothetical protein